MGDKSRQVGSRRQPRPFRRPLNPRAYRRKLAGRIFLEPDRAFLEQVTTTDGEGRIVLSRELTRDELGRLKKLRKAAKKNKRGPRLFRVAILAVVVAAVLVFNIVFKDRLVRDGAVALLEGLFAARVDLDGVRFRPIRGEIAFDRLAVADADAPMTNLFELSDGVIDLDSWQLVNRRILIDEIAVRGLQFGTERENSGAIVEKGKSGNGAETQEASGASASQQSGSLASRVAEALPEISFQSLGLPDTLDAQAFIEQNLTALGTPVAVRTLSGTATSFVDRWTNEIRTLTSELTSVADDVSAFAATDFRSIRSVDAAMSLYDDATSIQTDVAGMRTRIEASYDTLVAEATGILETARNLPSQATADYESLLALIPDIRGGGRDFVVTLVTPYVQEALGSWYDRILRGMDVYKRLTAEASERTPRRSRRIGTDFVFATTPRPRFLISRAELGVGAAGEEVLSIDLASLASEPDLLDEPAQVAYFQRGRAGELDVRATVDGRDGAANDLAVLLETTGTPLSISRGLDALSIDHVTGEVSVGSRLLRSAGGIISGDVSLVADELAVAGDYTAGSLGEFVADLLSKAGTLEGEFSFTMEDRSNVRFSGAETNLDDIVAGAVRERIDAALATFRQELETRVTAYLDPLIDSLNENLGGVVEVETSAAELLALARDREAAAAELKRLAQDSINSLRNQLEGEARAAIDAARAEAERRAQETLSAAEAEAERAAAEAEAQARAAAEEAASQAEEAVQDAAESAADSLLDRLPSRRR